MSCGEPASFHAAAHGPGTKLAYIFKALWITRTGCSPCSSMIAKMNEWGPDGCREHREEILKHLRKEYNGTSWPEIVVAVVRAKASGLASRLDRKRHIESLLDEAIRQSEVSLSQVASSFAAQSQSHPT